MSTELCDAVLNASRRDDVRQAVQSIYTVLADAIDVRRPVCKTSGRCCRFEEFGHRMYVTTMELAKFVADGLAIRSPASNAEPAPIAVGGRRLPILPTAGGERLGESPGCPFQVEGLCGVHTIRPFGCRIFFCDESSTAWQHELYERLHNQLRQMHDQLGVPYHYVEWRFALRTLSSVLNPIGRAMG